MHNVMTASTERTRACEREAGPAVADRSLQLGAELGLIVGEHRHVGEVGAREQRGRGRVDVAGRVQHVGALAERARQQRPDARDPEQPEQLDEAGRGVAWSPRLTLHRDPLAQVE